MDTTFKKRRDGFIINTDNVGLTQYQQSKKSVKALVQTKHELNDTKHVVASLQDELHEMKQMLQQLLEKKA